MNVPIRSWSGGRFFNEADQFFPSSFDDEEDKEWNINSSEDSEESLCSTEYYDDDFSEIESFYDDKDDVEFHDAAYSNIDEGSVGVEHNNHHPSTPESCFLRNLSHEEINNAIKRSSDHTCTCSSTDVTFDEKGTVIDANTRYRKWLSGIQKATKLKRQMDKDIARRKNEKQAKRRESLVLKARNRTNVAYHCTTEAARCNRIDRPKYDDTESLSNCQEIKIKDIEEKRRIYEMKHKEYLDRLTKQRQMELVREENERIKIDSMRRRITAKVMDDIRKRKDLVGHPYSQKVPEEQNEEDDELKPKGTNDCGSVKLKEKYIAEFTAIITERQRKEEEAQKLQRRLIKRAAILRKRYERNLHYSKPWKGDKVPKGLSQKSNEKSEANDQKDDDRHEPTLPTEGEEAQSKLVLTPSQVEALAARLYTTKQTAKSMRLRTDFGAWKEKNGVKANQKVFCMTGWYPSVSGFILVVLMNS